MDKAKWLVFVVKDFLGMLAVWQIDHTYSHFVWNNDASWEIMRFFTVPIYMQLTDFWVLCIFTLSLAVWLPEIYEAIEYAKSKYRL